MKRKLIFIILTCFIFTGFNYLPKENNINLNCVAAIAIDQESGRILYSKNSSRILPMASTTKIMTAIVALEYGNLFDKITVSGKAASMGGSSAGLRAGEEITLEELIYGLMMRSGNDASIAIAEYISGNTADFAKLMNQKAVEIGAYNTNFVTPHGLDADSHFTTAEDLARITAYAMKNSTFAEIVSAKTVSAGLTGKFNRTYSNINKFLYRIENSDGVKTGYTGKAGKCLVASVKNPYGRVIFVVLNSSDRWRDAEKMVKYVNGNYQYIKVFDDKEPARRLLVYGGNSRYITGITRDTLYVPLKPDEVQNMRLEVYAPTSVFSPVKKNEIVGNIVVFIGDKQIAKFPLCSDRDVERKNFAAIIKEMFN